MTGRHDATLRRFEADLTAPPEVRFELTLFVSGASDLAARAIASARRLCDVHVAGGAVLIVIDVQNNQEAPVAIATEILATPTLARTWPLPVRRVVGDLSNAERVLLALELPVADVAPTATGERR